MRVRSGSHLADTTCEDMHECSLEQQLTRSCAVSALNALPNKPCTLCKQACSSSRALKQAGALMQGAAIDHKQPHPHHVGPDQLAQHRKNLQACTPQD